MSVEGVVVSYNIQRGFGFIKSAATQTDVFFHVSEFRHDGLPAPGMPVTFELKNGADGRVSARDVGVLVVDRDLKFSAKEMPSQESYAERSAPQRVYSALVRLREGSLGAKEYDGTLELNDRRLQFEGRRWLSGKVIARPLHFVTSVEKPLFGSYVISGGGPKLFVSAQLFAGSDLRKLVSVIKSLL